MFLLIKTLISSPIQQSTVIATSYTKLSIESIFKQHVKNVGGKIETENGTDSIISQSPVTEKNIVFIPSKLILDKWDEKHLSSREKVSIWFFVNSVEEEKYLKLVAEWTIVEYDPSKSSMLNDNNISISTPFAKLEFKDKDLVSDSNCGSESGLNQIFQTNFQTIKCLFEMNSQETSEIKSLDQATASLVSAFIKSFTQNQLGIVYDWCIENGGGLNNTDDTKRPDLTNLLGVIFQAQGRDIELTRQYFRAAARKNYQLAIKNLIFILNTMDPNDIYEKIQWELKLKSNYETISALPHHIH